MKPAPDFVRTEANPLSNADLRFLIDHFPRRGLDVREVAQFLDVLPNTVESMLESDFVFEKIMLDRQGFIEISPFLFFNVLLRRSLQTRREPGERRVINYLAGMLSLFLQTERLFRVQPHEDRTFEYLVDLAAEAARSDTDRRFLVHSHMGNYALFLAGMHAPWIEHRYRFSKRTVSPDYYRQMGCSSYQVAARHTLAKQYGLQEVFERLASRFENYRQVLGRLAGLIRLNAGAPA
jgi:hypothetical protein